MSRAREKSKGGQTKARDGRESGWHGACAQQRGHGESPEPGEKPLQQKAAQKRLWAELSAHIWSHLVTPGHIWSYLVIPGHTGSYLATSGDIWSHLVTPGHIWSHLVTSVQVRAALEHPQRTGRAPRAAQLSRKSLGNPWQFQLPSPAALPALQGSHSSTCTARGQNPSPGARHGAAEARIQQPALPELGGKPGAGGEL